MFTLLDITIFPWKKRQMKLLMSLTLSLLHTWSCLSLCSHGNYEKSFSLLKWIRYTMFSRNFSFFTSESKFRLFQHWISDLTFRSKCCLSQSVIFLHFATYLSKNYVKMVDKQILFSNQRVFRQIGTHNYILELAFISNIALSFFFVISVNSQTTQYDLMLLLTWLFHIKSNMAPLLVFLFQKSTKVTVLEYYSCRS